MSNEPRENVLECIKQSVFNFLNKGQSEQANQLFDEWKLTEEERGKFVIPLKMPKITALSAGFNSGNHHVVTVNGQVYEPEVNGAKNTKGI